ncbi:MAG: oxygen-dependent coproporphyrinogen oxidase [Methylophilaceae bacterium]|nr:oxygen-dependent coproporphyrinogen oxidase [Methylophilaceae bacterium]MBL6728668.1 oxygen-dependent coproporphyrinogen oxidase [Methylophilaceae bacterium]MBL6790724.1 oxygen-dependent coproporphyrinogen oxidase [Methylophilaceae bacterium]
MTYNKKIQQVRSFLVNLQNEIVHAIEIVDKNNFLNDSWQRQEGGGGTTCILENGKIFERAGVSFSHVKGAKLPRSATQLRPELENRQWEALGVSLVFHPHNPFVPTVHMNVRFFIASKAEKEDIWWFGGGIDLTPYYPFKEDVIHFHQTLKNTLTPFGSELYQTFKNQCDDYFFLKHRNEPRGVGGIFYDDFSEKDFEFSFKLTQAVGKNLLNAYLPIVQKRKDTNFTVQQKDFQLYRRSRYVEFNLLQDRGTLFGIQSKGRVESILMSMPPLVKWSYDWSPQKNSPESDLYENFLIKKDWV